MMRKSSGVFLPQAFIGDTEWPYQLRGLSFVCNPSSETFRTSFLSFRSGPIRKHPSGSHVHIAAINICGLAGSVPCRLVNHKAQRRWLSTMLVGHFVEIHVPFNISAMLMQFKLEIAIRSGDWNESFKSFKHTLVSRFL